MDSACSNTEVITSNRLKSLEQVISEGRLSFLRVGSALKEIRDERLYKERGFNTFEAYCVEFWGFKRDYAYKNIDAMEVHGILYTSGIQEDFSERVLRPLTPLLPRAETRSPNESREKITAVVNEAMAIAEHEGKSLSERMIRTAISKVASEYTAKARMEGLQFSSIIKPSDNWNFETVIYGRIDDSGETHGYIPGEIYANVFWYYVNNDDEVCDLMAGSGQAMRVYEDKSNWGRGRDIEFNLRMFDRLPRGKYKEQIEQLDATKGLPAGYRPNLIFMDVPYFKMVSEAYSSDEDDIANMDWNEWKKAMRSVAASCANAQDEGSYCVVMAPNTLDWNGGRIMVCNHIRSWWSGEGYELVDTAYSTRRIQQNPQIRFSNNRAKDSRLMLSEMAEILVFQKI